MNQYESGWTTVGVMLLFGTLSTLFGLFGCWVSISLLITVDEFTWPHWGYLIASAGLHLITAIGSGYTCFLRLDGRPTKLSGALSLTLAIATPIITRAWFPFAYFFGM